MCFHKATCLVVALSLISNVTPNSRLSLADWTSYNYYEPAGAGTYAFGYDIDDPETNNVQFRNEERHANGTVTGSYGYVAPDGSVRVVRYLADEKGYRATEENRGNIAMLKPILYPGSVSVQPPSYQEPIRRRIYHLPPQRFTHNYNQGQPAYRPIF